MSSVAPTLSEVQRQVLAAVLRAHETGHWYRAARSGERVTLASLYRRGLLVRRAWRVGKCSADSANEYRCSEMFMEEWRRKQDASRRDMDEWKQKFDAGTSS